MNASSFTITVAPRSSSPRFALSAAGFMAIRTFGASRSPFYYPTSTPQTEAPAYPGPSPAGFTEAIAGWNFLDNTNDPYDDVHYGHGTGEQEDSSAEANNAAGDTGTTCAEIDSRT